jgi:electron transport complex protein RnfC
MDKTKKFKLFSIRGGVHPEDRKRLSAEQAIEPLPMPPLLHIPLQQHIGAPAEPLVRRGEMVKKGALLARSQGAISAPVHAPTSGRIMGIGGYPAHHVSGLSVRTITLKPDGRDEWIDSLDPVAEPFSLAPEEIARRVAEAGIVGMGGATFPSAVKLNLRQRYRLHTLVINGAECEPYLTCDDRLMRARRRAADGPRPGRGTGAVRHRGQQAGRPAGDARRRPGLPRRHGGRPAHPLPDGFRETPGADPHRP